MPDEAGDARGVADDVPRVVIQLEAHEQVAGEDLLLDDDPLAALELDDILDRDDDLVDALLHVHGLDSALEVRLHLVLVAGVGVHDEPLAGPVEGALDGRGRGEPRALVQERLLGEHGGAVVGRVALTGGVGVETRGVGHDLNRKRTDLAKA